MVLVDGFVRGTWKVTRRRRTATLSIEPFERIGRRGRAALATEGASLLGFVAPDAEDHDVAFASG